MHTYAALLGRNAALSTAELAAVLPDFLMQKELVPGILTFSTAAEIDQAFLNRLGGTILIARGITGTSAVTIRDLPSMLVAECAGTKGKVIFSLRCFGIGAKELKELYRTCKQTLKKKGSNSRYIGSEREAAKPIQLHDEGALDPKRGCELVVVRTKTTLWIGRTIAAQDVKAYTLRDIEKPVRDTTVGLLPPKLAQILLNFGEFVSQSIDKRTTNNEKHVVLDPFCGTGVIPLEALLRGCDVLASDVSLKAVSGTEKNLEWARKVYKILKKDLSSAVWKQDATKPFELKEKPDMIVTEGTLGPALKGRATFRDAEKYAREADALASAFLANCRATLPGVPVVLTLPVWYAQKKLVWLPKFFETCTEYGFTPVLPPHTDPSSIERFSLLYRRLDQFVGREIVILKPRK